MKKYILLLLAPLLLLSCKKFLEQPSYNNVSLDDIFKDFQGARTTLVGLYDRLKSTDYYLLDLYVYPELTGGNIKYSRSANQQQFYSYSFTRDAVANNDLKGFYTQAYSILYGANNILANVNRAVDATEKQKARLLADAHTIRALVHFDLVRTFAQAYAFTPDASHPGIILKMANSSVLTPTGTPSTVEEVYGKVLADLDSASALYANSVSIYPTGNAKTWLSADAVKALRNRVNLYKGDWAAVIAGTSELINAGQYPLMTTAQYVPSWFGQNVSSESIFELAYGNRIGGSLGSYYNPKVPLTSQFAATTDLLNLYAAGDVRGKSSLFVDSTINGITYSFTKKYQGTADSANSVKLFRNSESYLSRAEAYARTSNLTDALTDLNRIRKRANPAAVDFTTTDQQVLINEILAERRRELAFEGHLFFDISRSKKDLVRTDVTATIKSFSYPNPLFAYPIPVFQ